jgi:xanthine dehydrogenase molybdopterin-binding subunit B
MGIKGAGEAGTIGACPAAMNALVDALDRARGVRHIEMPATPERVWGSLERLSRQSARAAVMHSRHAAAHQLF